MMVPDISDMIGKQYEDFGRGPDAFDCVGVVLEVLRRAGMSPTDWVLGDITASESEWRNVRGVPDLSVLQVETNDGTGVAEHLAISIGGGMVIHALDTGVEVIAASSLPAPVSVVEYCGE